MKTRMPGKTSVIIICLAALAFRVSYDLVVPGSLSGDQAAYDGLAWNLAQGKSYGVGDPVEPTAYVLPAFPLLLASIYAVFGRDFLVARLVLSLISAVTVGIIYLISRRLFHPKVALLATALSAIYPQFIRYNGLLLTETLQTFSIALLTMSVLGIQENLGNYRHAFLGGISLALVNLTRGEGLLLGGIILTWLLWVRRDSLRHLLGPLAIMLIIALSCHLPWVIRNHLTFGHFIPTTTHSGATFYGGNNPVAFSNIEWMGTFVYSKYLPQPLPSGPEVERSQEYFTLAWDAIRSNFPRLPMLEVAKVSRLVFGSHLYITYMFPFLYTFAFGLILLIWERKPSLSLLYLLLIFPVIVALVFYGDPRLRVPYDPYLLMVSSYGVVEHVNYLLSRKKPDRPTHNNNTVSVLD